MWKRIGAVSVELTPDDLHDIESTVSGIEVKGDRYPPQMLQQVDR